MRSQTKRAYIVWGEKIINVEGQTSQGDPKKLDILSEAHHMREQLGMGLQVWELPVYTHIKYINI